MSIKCLRCWLTEVENFSATSNLEVPKIFESSLNSLKFRELKNVIGDENNGLQ